MPQRKYILNDPDFCEYVYNCLVNVPKEELANLSTSELSIFKTKTTMRKFADNESLEKRLLLLSRIHIPFTVVCAPREVDMVEITENFSDQFIDPKRRELIIKKMATEKMFVMSSKYFLLTLNMAAQNSHNQVYVLNYQYSQLRQKLKKTYSHLLSTDIRSSISYFDELSKILLRGFSAIEHCDAITKLSEFDLRVLLALLPARDKYLTVTKICGVMNISVRSRTIHPACENLYKSGFIYKMSGNHFKSKETRMYTIAEKGISTVMDFMKYSLKDAL